MVQDEGIRGSEASLTYIAYLLRLSLPLLMLLNSLVSSATVFEWFSKQNHIHFAGATAAASGCSSPCIISPFQCLVNFNGSFSGIISDNFWDRFSLKMTFANCRRVVHNTSTITAPSGDITHLMDELVLLPVVFDTKVLPIWTTSTWRCVAITWGTSSAHSCRVKTSRGACTKASKKNKVWKGRKWLVTLRMCDSLQ